MGEKYKKLADTRHKIISKLNKQLVKQGNRAVAAEAEVKRLRGERNDFQRKVSELQKYSPTHQCGMVGSEQGEYVHIEDVVHLMKEQANE